MEHDRLSFAYSETFPESLLPLFETNECELAEELLCELHAWGVYTRTKLNKRYLKSGIISPNRDIARQAIERGNEIFSVLNKTPLLVDTNPEQELAIRVTAFEKILWLLVPDEIRKILEKTSERIAKVIPMGFGIALIGGTGFGAVYERMLMGLNIKNGDVDIKHFEDDILPPRLQMMINNIIQDELRSNSLGMRLCSHFNGNNRGENNLTHEVDPINQLEYDVFFNLSFPQDINQRNREAIFKRLSYFARTDRERWIRLIETIMIRITKNPIESKYISPWLAIPLQHDPVVHISRLRIYQLNFDISEQELLRVAHIAKLGKKLYQLLILRMLLATGVQEEIA